MRRILGCLAFVVILMTFQVFAGTVYYVDATNGDDIKDGQSEANAWKTISKVNSQSFSPGDSILFKRGDTLREQLVPSSSGSSGNPITFTSYGRVNKPKIMDSDSAMIRAKRCSSIQFYFISFLQKSCFRSFH